LLALDESRSLRPVSNALLADEVLFDEGLTVEGKYRIVRALGRGGMGCVYEAEDLYLRRRVALKAHRLTDQASTTRLVEEAAAMARVNHPHVASVHALAWHQQRPVLVMELVQGTALWQVISAHYEDLNDPIPVARVLRMLADVADAISGVHSAGLVHRDIKPENVIVEHGTGRTVLVDFGVSTKQHNRDVLIEGTLEYLPPETFEPGFVPSASGDLYALGCLAYELLTGIAPFQGDNVREIAEKHRAFVPPPPSSLRPEAGVADDVVRRLLAKRPGDRPASAAQARALFRDANRLLELSRPGATPATGDVSEVFESGIPGSLRVLVVDDDPVFARLAARACQVALIGIPVSVARAKSAAAALEKMRGVPPDLLLLDYRLPDATGFDVLAQMRAMEGAQRSKVVLISGEMGQSMRWKFSSLGVLEFLAKPIDFGSLVTLIHRLSLELGWVSPHA
jgi:serine/threonine-protein kinase